MKKIGVGVSDLQNPHLIALAKQLAENINLPFSNDQNSDYNFLLLLSTKCLSLKKTNSTFVPLSVDYLSGKQTYRRQHASLRTELLARALGLKHNTNLKIIDATAGLGQDSFILASLGFDVLMLERSSIIHALVQDGIRRALEDRNVEPIAQRMHLLQSDAIQYLKGRPLVDVIYLDPMFPERQKSARVKKEMEVFRELLGEDEDVELLLREALACASQRVVVKRPRLASPILGPKPSFALTGRSSRFDVYLRQIG